MAAKTRKKMPYSPFRAEGCLRRFWVSCNPYLRKTNAHIRWKINNLGRLTTLMPLDTYGVPKIWSSVGCVLLFLILVLLLEHFPAESLSAVWYVMCQICARQCPSIVEKGQ